MPELHQHSILMTLLMCSIFGSAATTSMHGVLLYRIYSKLSRELSITRSGLVDDLLSEDDLLKLGRADVKVSSWKNRIQNINFGMPIIDSHLRGTSLYRVSLLAWPERYLLSFGLFCLIITSVCQMLLPILFGELLGSITELNKATFNHTTMVIIVVIVVNSGFAMMRGTIFNLCGERVVARLRYRVFRTLIEQDISFFDDAKIGELQSRLNNDTSVLQSALTSNISVLLRFSGQVIVALVVLFAISWRLTIIMILVVPLIVVIARVYANYVKLISKDYQKLLAVASDRSVQCFSLIRTVRSFGQEDFEKERYSKEMKKCYKKGVVKSVAYGFFIGVIGLLIQLSICLVLWCGGRMVISGNDELTTGKLTSFILYTFTIAAALGAISSTFSQMMSAVGASERLFFLIDREKQVLSGGELTCSTDDEPLGVKFVAVSFSYPSRSESLVLDSINLTIKAKQTTAIVGPSGGGKSTIMALLLRWYDPTMGMILVNDKPLQSLNLDNYRSNISVVSQEPLLFSCSILDNISYGIKGGEKWNKSDMDLRMGEIVRAAKEANAHDFIMNFPDGYDTLVGERGVQLSGGQKQRLAIARAVLRKPNLLLLDEATSALDSESEEIVQKALDKLMFEKNKVNTCVVIAHRLSTIKNADKILVISEGKLIQHGSHNDLLEDSTGLYYSLVSKQNLRT